MWAAMKASLAMITGLNRAYGTNEDSGGTRLSLVALEYAATVFG
jgi:hypothetical protein